MPTRTQTLRHLFGGGFATDYGPSVDAVPDQTGQLTIPFLVDAENVVFELDGGPVKIGGTSKVNSSALESGAVITGLYDYWRQGTGGSATRRRVVHVGGKVLSDADDGTFSNTLFTGMVATAVPNYATFDDFLIISNDNSADVPRSWDQTTAQNLAGSPPRFSFCVVHQNRAWAAGVYANPSRLYYSVNLDPEDWTGSGSGSIDIDPNDGDMITGLASHKNELIVFKGPNKGAIHRITGSSPTGGDAFARKTYSNGIGACWQNSIFRYGDELGFVSQFGTVHNLSATASFGDFFEVALSRPIHKWITDHLNFSRLRYISAVNNPSEGRVYFTCSIDSNTTNNCVLVMDYRRIQQTGRMSWSIIKAYSFGSLGLFVDSNGLRRILGGANDGYVKRLNMSARSLDNASSTAYNAKVTTPYINYGQPIQMKTISQAAVGIAPSGTYSLTFGWTRDNNAQQTQTVTQGGGDVLGPSSVNPFTLGTSTLGGAQYVDRYMELEEGGEFRGIQYQVTQGGLNEKLELHSISASIKGGALSTEN